MHLTHAELFKIKVTHRVKVRSKAKMQHFGLSSQLDGSQRSQTHSKYWYKKGTLRVRRSYIKRSGQITKGDEKISHKHAVRQLLLGDFARKYR